MTEQELIMDIAHNLIWLVVCCVVGGMLIGWYITFTRYRQKEREREAVEDYKREQRIKIPPKSYEECQRDILRDLQRFCDSYTVTHENKRWTYVNGLLVAERKFPLPDKNNKEDNV